MKNWVKPFRIRKLVRPSSSNILLVPVAPFPFRRPKTQISGVRCKHWIQGILYVKSVARPRIVLRIRHHPSVYRIPLDVSAALQQITVLFDRKTFEAPLPDVPTEAVAPAIPPAIRKLNTLEEFREELSLLRKKQQMNVVGHQTIVRDLNRMSCPIGPEEFKEPLEIAVLTENGLPIVSAPNDMIPTC